MDKHVALTDEELAEWERQVHGESAEYVTVHLAPKLIDALRAARERITELEAQLAYVDERIDSGEL